MPEAISKPNPMFANGFMGWHCDNEKRLEKLTLKIAIAKYAKTIKQMAEFHGLLQQDILVYY